MTTRIGVFLFDDATELDWAGPWEVLAGWATRWPEDDVEVFTVARTEGIVRCSHGLRVVPDRTWGTAGPIDVLVYPGGPGTRGQLGDEAIRRWVRNAAEDARIVMSVCTGALVLADAGLLDGRPATTHWRSLELLPTLGTGIHVRADERFVDTGDVITSAGISAGIDASLHLVSRLHSPERAREVRRQIQYDPEPPV